MDASISASLLARTTASSMLIRTPAYTMDVASSCNPSLTVNVESTHEPSTSSSANTPMSPSKPPPPPPLKLPDGWTIHQSSSFPGKVYFFNNHTGASAWDLNDIQRSSLTLTTSKRTLIKESSAHGEAQKCPKAPLVNKDEPEEPAVGKSPFAK